MMILLMLIIYGLVSYWIGLYAGEKKAEDAALMTVRNKVARMCAEMRTVKAKQDDFMEALAEKARKAGFEIEIENH